MSHTQVRSLIFMFANNIAQIACLLAEREGIHNIIFSGGFIRYVQLVHEIYSYFLEMYSYFIEVYRYYKRCTAIT